MSDSQYLTEITQVICKPGMYIGEYHDVTRTRQIYNVESNSVSTADVTYNAGIEHLFLEVISNAGDNIARSIHKKIPYGPIKVSIQDNCIHVYNDGYPISCRKKVFEGLSDEPMYIPEVLFGYLRTSTNYNESRQFKDMGGSHGFGVKTVNIMSSFFRVQIANAEEKVLYTQTWEDNMYVKLREGPTKDIPLFLEKCTPVISPYNGNTSWVIVSFTPDVSIFNSSITPDLVRVCAMHCTNLSLTTGVQVEFNGHIIGCETLPKYVSLFTNTKNYIEFSHDRSQCILVDSGNSKSIKHGFVNGILMKDGGTHIDTWYSVLLTPLVKELRNRIRLSIAEGKRNPITVSKLKDYLSLFIVCRHDDPVFSNQTKTAVKLEGYNVQASYDVSTVLSWECIKRFENDIKKSREKIPKIKPKDGNKLKDAIDAGKPSKGQKCTLYVTEGDGASNTALKISDPKYTGVLPLKGKLINASKCKPEKFLLNDEIQAIMAALNLRLEKEPYSDTKSLRYGRLGIMTDQDKDGIHIRMLVLNFFRVYFPSLLHINFIVIVNTPYVEVNNESFFFEKDYRDWIKEDERRSNISPTYYKGLGSINDGQMKRISQNMQLVSPDPDKDSETYMSMAFDTGKEPLRKEWVMSWNEHTLESSIGKHYPKNTISHMICQQLCDYAHYNVKRSIPSIIDGLKECQRKILCVMRGMSLKNKLKVSQIKGKVSDSMHYKHGEESLRMAIVCMADDCIGSNNIPWLSKDGQFNSRESRKSAASDRYIYAKRSPIIDYIIRKEDDILLEYNYEGSSRIEPKCYYPIVPMWLINGVIGIGSGFSTDIPAYNPSTIIQLLKEQLNGTKNFPPLIPWYRDYEGTIYQDETGKIYSKGHATIKRNSIIIDEIPVTQTISSYVKKLKKSNEANALWKGKIRSLPRRKEFKTLTGEVKIEILPLIEITNITDACIEDGEPNYKTLMLTKKISSTNITLLDRNFNPVIYEQGVLQALVDYYFIRLEAYKRRITLKIQEYTEYIHLNKLSIKFLEQLNAGKISVGNNGNMTYAQLKEYLAQNSYPESFASFGLKDCTQENINRILSNIQKVEEKLLYYQSTTPEQMWANELQELEAILP